MGAAVTALRILNLVVWGAMLAYMAPGAVAAVTRRARYGDPMRLACAATAFVFIGFNAYWLAARQAYRPDTTMNVLLLLSAALGAYILNLGRTYGRGARLHKDRGDD